MLTPERLAAIKARWAIGKEPIDYPHPMDVIRDVLDLLVEVARLQQRDVDAFERAKTIVGLRSLLVEKDARIATLEREVARLHEFWWRIVIWCRPALVHDVPVGNVLGRIERASWRCADALREVRDE
jgi:hypothetical protein